MVRTNFFYIRVFMGNHCCINIYYNKTKEVDMKFPISVYKCGNYIFLLQGQITDEMKDKIREINISPFPNNINCMIESQAYPQLTYNRIYINGASVQSAHKIVRVLFNQKTYKEYKDTIEFYNKRLTGGYYDN